MKNCSILIDDRRYNSSILKCDRLSSTSTGRAFGRCSWRLGPAVNRHSGDHRVHQATPGLWKTSDRKSGSISKSDLVNNSINYIIK